MKLSRKELGHILFLSGVAAEGHKRGLMEDALRCLSYIVKTLPEAEVSAEVAEEIREITEKIEQQLRKENDRLHEIRGNLEKPAYQRGPYRF